MSDTLYYDILGVKRSATDSDIKNAYRRAAFKWHPEKFSNPQEKDLAVEKFAEIAEAYTVLSDEKLRLIFDKHGQDGLRNGVNGSPSWVFTTAPIDVYTSFFGDSKPLTSLSGTTSVLSSETSDKPEPLHVNVYVSLEELFTGTVKQVKYIRSTVVDGEIHATTKIVQVTVCPGWKHNTKLTFPNAGDEELNANSVGDVIMWIKEKPHPRFTREKNDLVYKTDISLLHSLVGTVVEVPLLDGRVLSIPVTDIVKADTRMIVPNEGMPLTKDPKHKGNLIIEFNIIYPDSLSLTQKQQLATILPQ